MYPVTIFRNSSPPGFRRGGFILNRFICSSLPFTFGTARRYDLLQTKQSAQQDAYALRILLQVIGFIYGSALDLPTQIKDIEVD